MDIFAADRKPNTPLDPFSYPSFSTTATTMSAAPSPAARDAGSLILDDLDHDSQMKPPRTRKSSQYGAIGHLSYAPATQTTVVTTTTTTTTSFPPLFLNAPRQIGERDPKLYPLLFSPTPNALKRFCSDVGGRMTCFRETEIDFGTVLSEFDSEHATPRGYDGNAKSAPSSSRPTNRPNKNVRLRQQTLNSVLAPPAKISKRSVSPVSIVEAAEIASFQRRSQHSRLGKHAHGSQSVHSPATGLRISRFNFADAEGTTPPNPDSSSGSNRSVTGPQSEAETNDISESLSNGSYQSSQARKHLEGQKHTKLTSHHSSSDETLQSTKAQSPDYGYSIHDKSLQNPPPHPPVGGISATPPIVESDLEPLSAYETLYAGEVRGNRPAALDTTSLQDASLPSPSLSPITAAANLAQSSGVGSYSGAEHEDRNTHYFSSLEIDQDSVCNRAESKYATGTTSLSSSNSDLKSHDGANFNSQSSAPTLMDLPLMLDSFDAMPDEFKTYLMYQFLRRCTKSTLRVVADVVNPALKCDFIGLLPLELSLNIIRYLDVRSMCRAAQVSKKWRRIIDSDEKAWKDLLDRDGYSLPAGEVERAVREGWGWQHPCGAEGCEKDLSISSAFRSDSERSVLSTPNSAMLMASEDTTSSLAPSRPKRKAAAKFSSQKRQKRKPSSSKAQPPNWIQTLEHAQGPNAFANAAAMAVPDPKIGLRSLRSLHLFKSLYQRHHLIKNGWMQKDMKPLHLAFRAHQRHVVTCLQFDTDKILTGSDDTNINVYDTQTGALRTRLEGHEGGVWALHYEGNILVSGSTDRSVRVWDIEKGKCLQVFQGHTSTVRCLVILKPTEIGKAFDGTPVLMPKEPLIITGSRDSSLRIWKLPKLSDRSIFQTGPPASEHENPYFVRALTGHHHSVRAIAAHGDTLVSGSYDCSVRVWRISTGDIVHRLQGHAQKVYSVVLDHARSRCISGSMDNLVKVWSLETGACLFNLEGHTSLVGLLDLSHERLVSAAADSTLRIWDPETGQCKSTLSAHTGAITCFQHDGQKVISGSDRTLKMWNVKTGECVKDLLTDLSGVWQVKFNDRRCVAAVQRNNLTYIEVLDFGAARDGVSIDRRGRRIVVDQRGNEIDEVDEAGSREAA